MTIAYYFDSQETLDRADAELTAQGYVWSGTRTPLNEFKPGIVSINELVYVVYPEEKVVTWSRVETVNRNARYNLIHYSTLLKDISNDDIMEIINQ